MFTNISFSNWRQFGSINIDFHKQLTILTGPNGSGKTTILNIISQHFDWKYEIIGTPFVNTDTGQINFEPENPEQEIDYKKSQRSRDPSIGWIQYNNGAIANLIIPYYSHRLYNIFIETTNLQFRGLYITSNRPRYTYKRINSIPAYPIPIRDAFLEYAGSRQSSYITGYNTDTRTETYFLKSALLSCALFGVSNDNIQGNIKAFNIYQGFQEVLKHVLPKTLGFKGFLTIPPEVILETETGNFPIDSVSGGLTSIIDLAWQVFLYKMEYDESFVVCIDEPENHLHPQMQKDLLPNFIKAFPKIQFIVSTHSPFIISSVKDSNVYVLNYNSDKKIDSTLLNIADKSASANDILTNVLGLETTRPTWVEEVLDNIINKYLSIGITTDNIDKFRQELKSIGFEKYLTSSVVELLDRNRHHDKN